jgi:hypothetical protein
VPPAQRFQQGTTYRGLDDYDGRRDAERAERQALGTLERQGDRVTIKPAAGVPGDSVASTL